MFRKLFVFICLTTQISVGQQPEFPNTSLKVGYYGNLVLNPGLSGSYEFTLLEGVKTKGRIKRERPVNKYKFNRLTVAPSLGFYADPGSNFNAFANVSLLYRRINRKGRTFAVGPGIGYLQSFMDNVYTFDQGNISESGLSSFGYIAPSFRIETGKFKTKHNKRRGWYAALSSNFLLDYNATVIPTPAIEFGKFF